MEALVAYGILSTLVDKTMTLSRAGGSGGDGVWLFGVRLDNLSCVDRGTDDLMLPNPPPANNNIDSLPVTTSESSGSDHAVNFGHQGTKGLPWTEEEHKQFLLGLNELGRGQWRSISKFYVKSRSPAQVASHAQKYFIHQKSQRLNHIRPSVFDLNNVHVDTQGNVPVRNESNQMVDASLTMPIAPPTSQKKTASADSEENRQQTDITLLEIKTLPLFE